MERFDDRYFQDTATYSELLLSSAFYQRFSDYDYMLVYQLDAFAFSDRLDEFCAMGYDYIGAPYYRWQAYWKDIDCSIGNGGFSLRKIDSTLRVLARKEEIFQRRPAAWKENCFRKWEDLFFSFCAKLPEFDFRVPSFPIALDFAVCADMGHAYRKIPGWMPFGCHGWNVIDYWFWRPLVEACGYDLPATIGKQGEVHRRRSMLESYAFLRLQRTSTYHVPYALAALKDFLTTKSPIVLWGYGKRGKVWFRLLREAGVSISAIFDRSAAFEEGIDGVTCMKPSMNFLKEQRAFVIVTTIVHESEICDELAQQGFVEMSDFVRNSYLVHWLTKYYLKSFHPAEK